MKTVAETIGKIKEFRNGITLGGISVRELIETEDIVAALRKDRESH